MRILMFGWEFPPYISGGLGVACEGLVRGLVESGVEVTLVLPHRSPPSATPGLRILSSLASAAQPNGRAGRRAIRMRRVPSLLRPYITETVYEEVRRQALESGTAFAGHYGPDLPREVLRYAAAAAAIAAREPFDVIHAHDWLTFLAGIEARRASGKPLVLHVHATEFDRSGNGDNAFVTSIERTSLAAADRVIAVSGYTADVVTARYGVPADRLRVVHNAVNPKESVGSWTVEEADPLVLFAGRLTWQKGPEYFVDAAARVAAELPGVKFAVAGSGDRMGAMVERVAFHGLESRFLFTGFLPPAELDRLYARADLYVMPSASEPFGLTALEALQQGTPVIVSRTAGVSEVVRNVLRVDFGDVEDLASKILSVLLYPPLRDALASGGRAEVRRLSWRDAAERCLSVYRELVGESDQTP
jgi:glycosyltransferase involved in cell wall biosynthesis